MPSEQHEQWKRDLFSHLEHKLSGCLLCEIGKSRDDHSPTHRGQHLNPSQEIVWTCERMHPHAYDVLRGAGFVEMEKYQAAPRSGRCCPDITILDTHRKPQAFIEIVRHSRPRNSLSVAEELGIPLFTILAPHRRSLRPGLQPARPWWDFDPTLPADTRNQMYFMEQVADELMQRHRAGDSTWSELDMMVDDDGRLQYARLRGSPPDLSAPTFPRTGDLVVAELCSWNCDKAMEVLRHEQRLDEQAATISIRQTLEQDVGRAILRAIALVGEGPAKFVVPVGTQEVHVEVSLEPLNPHVDAGDPTVLSLRDELAKAGEKVRNRHRRGALPQDSEGGDRNAKDAEGRRS